MVVELHPAYDDASITFDDGLVGTWKSDEDDTTVEFAHAEWRSYRVTVRTPRESTTVTAHLTRVGDAQLLDVMPASGIAIDTLSIAVHVVYRVSRDGDVLTVSALDYEAARHVSPDRLGIEAVLDGRQNVVITAGTNDLRRWLAGKGSGMFAAGSSLRRVQAG
jgi:hypothetical protein